MPRPETGLITDDRGITRCWWCVGDPLYVSYHDTEWGVPSRDDRYIFEKICLEGFQAGLSWLTILKKRENFRKAFRNFDVDAVAWFTARDIDRLLADSGIVRHRGKIESTINNAKRARALRDECGTLADFVWRFTPDPESRPKRFAPEHIVAETTESKALSKELKKRGWSFVGPTTMYAFMQSIGIVNDHIHGCFTRKR